MNVEWSETCSVALPLLATVVPIEASLSESDSMINDHAFQGERSRTHAHKFTIRSHLPIIPVYYLSAYYSKNYASIICQPLVWEHLFVQADKLHHKSKAQWRHYDNSHQNLFCP